ncbi:unnamed protein product [Rhizoctonia solani]|uniref:F-box domain-containing protein n=1 Tax=Rhizoctonia solani TaxID=456999 RepID=A0A8H3HBZ4_9AGAM|nr:unnamed protein product [Rhizoctonia solani]
MKSDLYAACSRRQNPLLLPEIAQWIYYFSREIDGHHLAQTCSHLFSSLIPLVWADVNGVERLLALIAGTKISVDSNDNMQIFMAHKSLTDEDLRRFNFYAPFVKRLNCFKIEKYSRYRLRGWKQLLTALGSSPLLPNLHILTFNTRPTTTPFEQQAWFMLLLSPPIQELSLITTSTSNADLNASAAELFFRCVSTTLLGITDLPSSSNDPPPHSIRTTVISTRSDDVERISWLTTVRDLASLSQLFISMSTLRAGQLSSIGLLPRLESLELDFDVDRNGNSTSSYTTPNLPDDAFPRLRHFGLINLPDVPSFHAIWSLTPLVSNLTSVTLHFNKYRWMNVLTHDEIISDFIHPISEKSPDLVDIAIHPPEYEWNEAESSAPMFGLIARLPLTKLRFAPMVPLHISIPRAAGEYHLLRRLELPTSWVEVADIKTLAIAFPNLEYLALQITIHPGDFEDDQPTPTSPRPIILRVLSVFLEEDPLWDGAILGEGLARLLHSLWPKARYLTNESDILRYKFIPPWGRTRLFI